MLKGGISLPTENCPPRVYEQLRLSGTYEDTVVTFGLLPSCGSTRHSFLHFVFVIVGFYNHLKGQTNGVYLASDNV